MYKADEDIVAVRRAAVEAAIRDIRGSLPVSPWATLTHTDLGVAVRPKCDWQRQRVEMNLRLNLVSRNIEAARESADLDMALRLLDDVEDELRDLGANALPQLSEAIASHDAAAKRQLELEELRDDCRRNRARWARWIRALGFIARRRRNAMDEEIRSIDEQLRLIGSTP